MNCMYECLLVLQAKDLIVTLQKRNTQELVVVVVVVFVVVVVL